MNRIGIASRLSLLMVIGYRLDAQSGCGLEHQELGTFICYPNPAEHAEDLNITEVFHLSAQGNAPADRKIRRYLVLIDGHRIYEKRLSIPLQHISIETNLKSPFSSGQHTLRLVVDGVGNAQVSGLNIHPLAGQSFCDPFSRVDARNCVISRIREPLNWSVNQHQDTTWVGEALKTTDHSFAGFIDYLELYIRNLETLEADVADATAIDTTGNLYVASHSFGDIDLRKYTNNGSLIYDAVVRSNRDGFLSIEGVAVNDAGRVWIIGNTTAAFPTTPGAVAAAPTEASGLQGFAMLLDTSKPGSSPIYFTYLSIVENRVRSIRVDRDGNAYIAGTTISTEFPHRAMFTVGEYKQAGHAMKTGFVALLNASGSDFIWSTLLCGSELNGLAIDDSKKVYVTGRSAWARHDVISEDTVVAALSDSGRKLAYLAHFGTSGMQEGYAISTKPSGDWLFVTGFANTNSLRYAKDKKDRRGIAVFAMALQPCRTGFSYSRVRLQPDNLESAMRPALDIFASSSPGRFPAATMTEPGKKPIGDIQLAPDCSSASR